MKVIEIGDVFPPELEIYTTLKENQLSHYYEPAPGLFIAESPQLIQMALAAGYEPESYLLESTGEPIEDGVMSNKRDVLPKNCEVIPENCKVMPANCKVTTSNGKVAPTVYIASHEAMKKLTGYELTGGALAAFRRKPLPGVEEVLKEARRVVVLECVMNPRNIGSIFRSAAAIGFDAVLLTKGACDPLYRRAARVSMGTVFQIPWTYIDDMSVLKEKGFVTVAMALTDESVSMADPVLKGHGKLAVLMGSERSGLQEETIRACDYTAKIPMKHGVDSLNVAAASAVAFWELRGEQGE